MIDVFVEILVINRSEDNRNISGLFKLSSQTLGLSRQFKFLVTTDRFPSPTKIGATIWKEEKEFCRVSGAEMFSQLTDPQKIVMKIMDEALNYYFGVHPDAKDVPDDERYQFFMPVHDDRAMDILAIAI